MAKIKIGFDIGNNSMKIAIAKAGEIRFEEVRMPENLMENGAIAMPNAFPDFLKKTKNKLHLPKGEAALVLPSSQVLCRMLMVPRMSEDQLLLNLPYEFSDFIRGDTEQYYCDYAVCEKVPEDAELEEGTITMMAAAVAKEQVYQYIQMFGRAGIKLKLLLPQEMALISLVKKFGNASAGDAKEYCFVDLGHLTTRITVVYHDRIRAMREIGYGCRNIDLAIAEQLDIDEYLANSYKASNYQDVLSGPACAEVYNQIAVEILKVINFYQYTYRNSTLSGIYLAGGGANIEPLCREISELLGMAALSAERFLPFVHKEEKSCLAGLFAAGMAVAEKGE